MDRSRPEGAPLFEAASVLGDGGLRKGALRDGALSSASPRTAHPRRRSGLRQVPPAGQRSGAQRGSRWAWGAGRRSTLALVALLSCLLLPGTVQAHASGESYVWLNAEADHIAGHFEIRLDDLREHLGLEISQDPEQTEAQVLASADEVQRYLRERFAILIEGRELSYDFTSTAVTEAHGHSRFAQFYYRSEPATIPDQITVRNQVLLEVGRLYRSLLCIEYDRRLGKEYGEEFTALVFSSSQDEQVLDFTDIRGLLRVREFIWQGVLHIWIGIDHVLFLVALLLTSVMTRGREGAEPAPQGLAAAWRPARDFRAALWTLAKIVTLFTIAHSITLSLAALDWIRLPSRLVESIIAASIVLVAANNLFPRFREGNWLLIFGFGLFHGMGFASVMGELPFRMMHLVKVILAFNIGVELGQLAIVVVLFPIFFQLRRSTIYRPVFLIAGSVLIGLLAGYWFLERALGW